MHFLTRKWYIAWSAIPLHRSSSTFFKIAARPVTLKPKSSFQNELLLHWKRNKETTEQFFSCGYQLSIKAHMRLKTHSHFAFEDHFDGHLMSSAHKSHAGSVGRLIGKYARLIKKNENRLIKIGSSCAWSSLTKCARMSRRAWLDFAGFKAIVFPFSTSFFFNFAIQGRSFAGDLGPGWIRK